MSYFILLDSSNTSLSVGLAKEDILLDYVSYEAWQEQSEHMIPELNSLLEKHNVNRDEISGVIVANGPGSYTGVRISITIAKVIATALKCELYLVSSLRVQKCGDKPSICVINARSNRSYIGVYEGNNIILPDQIMTNDKVMEYIESHNDYVVCGNAKYLGLEGYSANICLEMLSLKSSLEKLDNPMAASPIYMKD